MQGYSKPIISVGPGVVKKCPAILVKYLLVLVLSMHFHLETRDRNTVVLKQRVFSMCIVLRRSREEDGVFAAVANVALELTLFTSTGNCKPEISLEKHVRRL